MLYQEQLKEDDCFLYLLDDVLFPRLKPDCFVAGWPCSSSDSLQIFHKELLPSPCLVPVKWFKQETLCLSSLCCLSLFPPSPPHFFFAGVWFHLLRPECWQHITACCCLWSSVRQISIALKLATLHCFINHRDLTPMVFLGAVICLCIKFHVSPVRMSQGTAPSPLEPSGYHSIGDNRCHIVVFRS